METQELRDLLKGWTPPVELRRSTPREVCLTRGGMAVLVVVALMVVGGLVGSILMDGQKRHVEAYNKAMLAEGRDAEGVVSRLWHSGGRDEQYWVAYRFTANEQTYDGRSKVSRRHWQGLHAGDPIGVRYVASQPRRNNPTANPPRPIPWAVPWAFPATLWPAAFMLWCKVQRQRKLLADGKPAPAVVGKSRRVYTHEGAATSYVPYKFPLADGTTVKGRFNSGKQPPAEGSVICILYHPDHPRWNDKYPMCLARIDRD